VTMTRVRLRTVGVAAVVVLAASVATLAVTTTTTPVRLRSAAPANGASLTAPPDRIRLHFTSRPDPAQVHVTVVDAAQERRDLGGPTVTGDTVVQRVGIDAGGGYLVGYHVVFGNGRQASGLIGFTVLSGPPAGGPSVGGPSVGGPSVDGPSVGGPSVGPPGSGPTGPTTATGPTVATGPARSVDTPLAIPGNGSGHNHARLDGLTYTVVGVDLAVLAVGLAVIRRRHRPR
jgi:methionine-rich copper-binding protein CopC